MICDLVSGRRQRAVESGCLRHVERAGSLSRYATDMRARLFGIMHVHHCNRNELLISRFDVVSNLNRLLHLGFGLFYV